MKIPDSCSYATNNVKTNIDKVIKDQQNSDKTKTLLSGSATNLIISIASLARQNQNIIITTISKYK